MAATVRRLDLGRVVVAERGEQARLVGGGLGDRIGDRSRHVRSFRCLAGQHAAEARLVEDRDAELLRLGQLRAGALAGDEVVGLLRDRPGRLAAGGPDRLLRLLAG